MPILNAAGLQTVGSTGLDWPETTAFLTPGEGYRQKNRVASLIRLTLTGLHGASIKYPVNTDYIERC